MRYRYLVVPVVGAILVLGGFLVFGNLNNNVVYYLSPAQAIAERADFPDGERFRLGGVVTRGSVDRSEAGLRFAVRGGGGSMRVSYTGAPAQLFRPGIAVVLEGSWDRGTFRSETMMIKHDSEYAPPTGAPSPERQS